MDATEPAPPADLPTYVTEPLQRQGLNELRQVRDYVDELIGYHEAVAAQDLNEDELEGEGEEIVDKEETSSGTRVVKKVNCGKESCNTCPHGPYLYLVTREGDSLNWDYRGRASEAE